MKKLFARPEKKINFKKQAAIRKQWIKKNEITKGIRKYASHGEQFLNKRCLETASQQQLFLFKSQVKRHKQKAFEIGV